MQRLENGTQLGAYTIVRLLGRGGMGEVYEAYEKRLQRRVAIKVISPQKDSDHGEGDLVRRFLQEARTLAQVNHPNVVTIYAIDRIQDIQFIAMEFVDGALLKDIFSAFALSADEGAPMFIQMLEGLRSLHDNKILHRDLKPHNLMLRPNGQMKILDFGIAKREGDLENEQTTIGVVVGTLAYLPPEVLYGTPANVRSDLWSIGAIFYECLCGQPLVSLHKIKVRGVRGAPDSEVVFPQETLSWIPEEMRRIVAKLCDSNPENRYASAALAIEDLRRYQLSRPSINHQLYSSLSKAVEDMDEFRRRVDIKALTTPKAKRALTLSLVSGTETSAVETSKLDQDKPFPSTETIPDSISARRKARRRARQKQNPIPWTAVLAGLVLVVGLALFSYKINRNETNRRAEVTPSPQLTTAALSILVPQDHQTLWLEPTQIPTFIWSHNVNVGDYELQIGTDGEVNSILVSEKVSGSTYRPSRIIPEGRYQWRLLSLRGQSEQTAVNHFVIAYSGPVELISPSANAVFEVPRKSKGESVPLAWKCKMAVQKYRAQISSDPEFQSIVKEQVESSCNLEPSLLKPGTYYWHVRAEEPVAAGTNWSEARKFVVKSVNPAAMSLASSTPSLGAAPVLSTTAPNLASSSKALITKKHISERAMEKHEIALENDKLKITMMFSGASPVRNLASVQHQITNPPLLSWKPISAAKSYELQTSSSSDFSRQISEVKTKLNKYEWRAVVPGRSYWRVRAIAENGEHGAFSAIGTVDALWPAPKFKAGEKNMLSWSPVPLTEKYVVQMSTEKAMKNITEKVTSQPKVPLEMHPAPLYMRVAALNTSGDIVSDFSGVATVSPVSASSSANSPSTRAPSTITSTPTLMTPPRGKRVKLPLSGRISVLFSWSKVEGTKDYTLEVSVDPSFGKLIEQQTVTNLGFLMKEAELDGPIYWRVCANLSSGTQACSSESSFEVR